MDPLYYLVSCCHIGNTCSKPYYPKWSVNNSQNVQLLHVIDQQEKQKSIFRSKKNIVGTCIYLFFILQCACIDTSTTNLTHVFCHKLRQYWLYTIKAVMDGHNLYSKNKEMFDSYHNKIWRKSCTPKDDIWGHLVMFPGFTVEDMQPINSNLPYDSKNQSSPFLVVRPTKWVQDWWF